MQYEIITTDGGLRLPPIDLTVQIKDLGYKIYANIIKAENIQDVHKMFDNLINKYREGSPSFKIEPWVLTCNPLERSFSINYGTQKKPQYIIKEVNVC